MKVQAYCSQLLDQVWENKTISDSDKVHAAELMKHGYDFIARKIVQHHGDNLTPDSVRDIGLLEGFLITFIQHGADKEQLQQMGAIIG